jgi:ubiquinone/menaquinone biosynthesis C-methylase UbiE
VTIRAPGADGERLDRQYGDSAKLRGRLDIYDWQQPRYDLHAVVPAFAPFRPGDRVLDVGCGPGHALERLAARPEPLTLFGLDRSVGMVCEASGRSAPGVQVVVGDVVRLPVRAAGVDVVLAMHMLYHASDPAAAVAELRRVLRPGGTAVVSTLAEHHLDGLRELVDDALAGSGLRWGRNRLRFDPAALQTSFEHVERHELDAEVVVDDVAPVTAYVESTADFYDPPGGWAPVVAHVEEAVTARLARDGVFRIRTGVDVYVCR